MKTDMPNDPPIDDAEPTKMMQFVRRYDSANCWTGTTGTACRYILRLLNERRERIEQTERRPTCIP